MIGSAFNAMAHGSRRVGNFNFLQRLAKISSRRDLDKALPGQLGCLWRFRWMQVGQAGDRFRIADFGCT